MKTVKLVIAWMVASVLIIATLPISLMVHLMADSEYFWTDYYQNVPPPRYYIKWHQFLESPFKLFGYPNN